MDKKEKETALRAYFSCFSVFIIFGIGMVLLGEEKDIFQGVFLIILGGVVVVPISIYKIWK